MNRRMPPPREDGLDELTAAALGERTPHRLGIAETTPAHGPATRGDVNAYDRIVTANAVLHGPW